MAGIDLSPVMLAAARDRAGGLGLDVDLREASADALPFVEAAGFAVSYSERSKAGIVERLTAVKPLAGS